MTQTVAMPDGTVHVFPDAATPEQITGVLAPSAPKADSLLSRFGQGLRDPADGLAQLALHAIPGMEGPARTLDIELATRAGNYGAPEGIDWARMGGNVSATLPAALAVPGGGASLAARTGIGAAAGAGFGAMTPVTNNTDDFWSQKGIQSGIGAAVGGVAAPVTGALARVMKPNVNPDVQTLLDAGVTPTPGQTLGGFYKSTEDKLTSVPGLGDVIKGAQRRAVEDLNKAVYNRALNPIGQEAGSAVGNEGIDAVSGALSSAYQTVLPKMTFAPDAQLATAINNTRNTLSPSLHSAFDEKLQTALLNRVGPNGTLTGDGLKNAESELGSFAHNYSKSSNASEREVGSALKQTVVDFRDALQRQNPNYAGDLQATNRGYASQKIALKAASRDINGGVFSPAQLQQSVRTAGGSDRFARGIAPMQDLSQPAQNVLGGGYPDSGSVGRAMVGLAGAAALGHVNPMIPIGAGIGMLPYTPWGQKLAVSALTRRPQMAGPIANTMRVPPAVLSSMLAPFFVNQ